MMIMLVINMMVMMLAIVITMLMMMMMMMKTAILDTWNCCLHLLLKAVCHNSSIFIVLKFSLSMKEAFSKSME